MRAIVLTSIDPLCLQEQNVPAPTPGPGQVVVSLRAAALNHRDLWITKGQYSGIRLPVVLGSDGAGVVTALGEGVSSAWLGSEVIIYPSLEWGPDPEVPGPAHRILGMPDDGTLAEQVVVPEANLVRKPAHLSWEEAAALPLAGLTAYRALRRGRLRPGETVLVPGIGGGVSTMVMLLARHLGARVLVTSGSADKLRRAAALGAEVGVCHTEPDWDAQLLARAGRPPDLVVDGAGGDTFARALALVRPGGRVVTYGATLGPARVEVRRIFWKQLDVLGTTMGTPAEFRQMVALVEAGGLRPVVDTTLPLAETASALQRLDRGEQMGKVVLRISS
ncbi:MAG: zinc-binding dehydrogenase [Myxococcales bacterium]|nr:zinc-binding dehydrogenase [Myxococcota bacterium]MDW8283838.1 zinc-binding dehydrogenase [Myxococcales bacterium]